MIKKIKDIATFPKKEKETESWNDLFVKKFKIINKKGRIVDLKDNHYILKPLEAIICGTGHILDFGEGHWVSSKLKGCSVSPIKISNLNIYPYEEVSILIQNTMEEPCLIRVNDKIGEFGVSS
ncbi:hypothetical protein [Peptostreptococcus faecalis]|uniref:hypothetical protein n=1 Tax=Peptostreptococcus faecalis TaxID=2045015 RepID=UPI000C7978FE|nr:hypothetical protein [Peptostreptococcus faecalis]